MKKNKSTYLAVILNMFLGIIFGLLLSYLKDIDQDTISNCTKHIQIILKVISQLYINMLKMMMVPIITVAVLYGIINISDLNSFNRIGLKSFLMYTFSSIISVTIGILIALIFKPGIGVNLNFDNIQALVLNGKDENIITLISNIIPINPIESMAKGNTMQIVFFTSLLGIATISIDEKKSKDFKNLIDSLMHIIFKLVDIIMKTTPYGVFATMSCLTMNDGLGYILQLSWFIFSIFFALFIQYIVFFIAVPLFANISPIPFFKKIIGVQSVAFSTSSTKATLAFSIEEMQSKIGSSKKITNFILPIGASINMSASSIYMAIASIFFAQSFGIELSIYQYVIIVIACTIGSIGVAGAPSGSVIMLSMVLTSINIPLVGIPILISIDRIIDMTITVINVTGDCVVALIIDKNEDTLDMKKYYE